MVACLSPSDRYFEENLSTLNYAAQASQISNIPTKNIDPKLMIMNDQKRKIGDLEKELKSANQHIQHLTQLNYEKDAIIEKLNKKIAKAQQQSQQQQKALDLSMMKQRHLESQVTDPDSPTSPKQRGGSLLSPTTLPNIATSKSGNRSSIAGVAADYVSPNKTSQGGAFQFATNPNNTLSGANGARMAATGTAFYDKQKQDA